VRKAVADSVPPGFRDLNLKAFERGFEYGQNAFTNSPNPETEAQMVFAEE
jgi:Pyruvate/2-oxoacid:ferredoxin oxidoreductase gamma subunit